MVSAPNGSPPPEPRGARRLFQTFVSLVGAEIVTRGLVLVTGVVLARTLVPGDFGEFSYAFGIAILAGFLVDLGLSALVIRDVSEEPTRAAGLLAVYLRAQLVLVALTLGVVASLTFGGLLDGPAARSSILIAAAAVGVGAFSRPFEAVLTGRARAHLVTVSRAVRGLVLAGGTLGIAVTDPGVDRFLLVWVGSEAAGVAAVAALTVRAGIRPSPREGGQLGRLLRLAVPFALVTAASVFYLRVDVLMLGQMDTKEGVGNYGVASRVMDAAIIIPAFFGNAYLSTIANTGPRSELGRMQTTEALGWIVLITAPFAVTLAVAATPIITLLTGGGYESADDILLGLSPVVLAVASYGVLASLQVALDQVWMLAKLFTIGLVVKVAANAWAIPAHGARGAAVTAACTEVMVACIQWVWARHYFDTRTAAAMIARVFAAAAVMAGVMTLAVSVLPWAPGIAIGLAAYPVAALATGAISRERARAAVAAVRTRPAS